MERYEFTVVMEDGDTWQVVADQRDMAKWEVQPFGCSTQLAPTQSLVLWVRYLAWSGSVRHRHTVMTWEQWQDRCLDVTEVEEPGGADDASDPGQPDTSGSPSSGSPSAPANPSRARRGSKAGTRGTSPH